jgi:hypothetical protein
MNHLMFGLLAVLAAMGVTALVVVLRQARAQRAGAPMIVLPRVPVCSLCAHHFRRQFRICVSLSLVVAVLTVVALATSSRPIAGVGLVILAPVWWYGRRALRAYANVCAAEETAARVRGGSR